MNTILGELAKDDKFVELTKAIEKGTSPISILGLAGVAEVFQMMAIKEFTKKPVCIVTYDETQAQKIVENIKNFTQDVAFFPKKEIVTYDYVAESNDITYERMKALNKIVFNKNAVLVTTAEAVKQEMPTKEAIYKDIIKLKVGGTYNLDDVKQRLVNLGYIRQDMIDGAFGFSVRGGIVDVAISENEGMRIEFWGDEVDSIRKFDIATQRSIKKEEEFTVLPVIENVQNIDKQQGNVLDFIQDNCVVFLDEINKIRAKGKNIDDLLQGRQIVYLEKQNINNDTNTAKYKFEYREVNYFKSETEELVKDIKEMQLKDKKVYLLVSERAQAKQLSNLLNENEILNKIEENLNSTRIVKLNAEIVTITIGFISNGFEAYNINQVVINANGIVNVQKKRRRTPSVFKESKQVIYSDLRVGDYVVHKTYGIGVFVGVHTITADGTTKDYIKIQYKGEDVLYVPTTDLDNVRKYVGTEKAPKINRLGGKEWENTKAKVKNNLREIAKELIELYAKRENSKGYAFSKDTPWQSQFESGFQYIETDDQLRCIEEVKKDMEAQKPMDRLLCGDVGYGKTEVAIRAAFKAVMDQKQVAYLAPTTVLSNQQYKYFKERMSEFPVRIELLNRFKTEKEQQEIVKKLKLGEIDIIIGTHRILSKDVSFKDLGLLIVDEEHRFGVKDKEKIKQYKTNVDVLTMTATPIPRTLHMSIVGVRDMSVIYEPPHNRKPVQTYVLEYDEKVIKDVITKELERGGQVFYIFNNVSKIAGKAESIKALIPKAKVSFAHGRMSGTKIEDIMQDFVDKKTDILVCTTILESGIDIPNANTIIVENADRMGLAQLYQIKGRVGRSQKQAYAYITYKKDKVLSEVAEKRLKAIKEFTEFGSGFKIALRDLEIRGAGSLLGEIQHGHLEQVGYDTYCRLLNEVIKESRGEKEAVSEEIDVQIDLNVTSYIPDEYISSSSQKIEVYQDIALCKTDADIKNVTDEIIDRFGNMPKEVENLIQIAEVKNLCRKQGITKASNTNNAMVFKFASNEAFKFDIGNLVSKYGDKIKFSSGIKPIITYKVGNIKEKELLEKVIDFLKEE